MNRYDPIRLSELRQASSIGRVEAARHFKLSAVLVILLTAASVAALATGKGGHDESTRTAQVESTQVN